MTILSIQSQGQQMTQMQGKFITGADLPTYGLFSVLFSHFPFPRSSVVKYVRSILVVGKEITDNLH